MKPILFFSAVSILSASTLPARHEFNTLQDPRVTIELQKNLPMLDELTVPPVPPFNKFTLPPEGPNPTKPGPTANTPEPMSWALVGSGLLVFGLRKRE